MTALSKALIVLGHSKTGIVGSNPSRGMDVYLWSHIFMVL